MRWLHVERSGMWFAACDDSGEVWGFSGESAIHACAEARQRRAAGKCSISAEWMASYHPAAIDSIEIEVTFKA